MSEYIKYTITESIALMPLRAITIFDNINNLTLFQLEAESSYQIVPITRTNDEGGQKSIAYKLNATIYCPFNKPLDRNEEDFIGLLDKLKTNVSVTLALGDIETWSGFNEEENETNITNLNYYLVTKPINCTGGGYIQTDANANITYEIESVEFRSRLIIRVQAFMRSLYNNLHLSNTTTSTSDNYLLNIPSSY